MSNHLCITVRWITERFHGFIDGTEALEWPPSPFRLFQALLAGAHRYGLNESLNTALGWLEGQVVAPEIFAASHPSSGTVFDHFVPDNDNSLMHRRSGVRKFCPLLLNGSPIVHYLWQLNPDAPPPLEALDELTSTLSALGWAIDQAYATVQVVDFNTFDSDQLVRFTPRFKTTDTLHSLRVPKKGSIADLRLVHSRNSVTLANQGERRRKKWPKGFDRVVYTSTERPIGRPCVVFKLLDANDDAYRYPHSKLVHIAGMVRHLAIERMKRDPPPWTIEDQDWVNRVVRGKQQSNTEEHRRFSYVPLPSIGHEHSDALIRNVMVVAPLGMERELDFLARRLDGELLTPEGDRDECKPETSRPAADQIVLQKFKPPAGKFIANCYLGTSDVWQTVTPVILDGHNKKSKSDKPEAIARETEKLICKALARSGIEAPCEFTWQAIPFVKHCLSAHKYDRDGRHTGYHRPGHLNGLTAVHVRLTFQTPMPGPITIGAGRHCGLGLFMAVPNQSKP